VEVRRAISEELRKFLTGGKSDKAKILALGRRYGEMDGEMSWIYATAFAKVGRTLTAEQRAACMKLRNLDGYQSAPAYLYSNPLSKRPALPNSDFLFRSPTQSASEGASTAFAPAITETSFTLRSSAFTDGGRLPVTFTGDGESVSPPLEWNSPPTGTKAFAVIMHHIDPEGVTKWYWTLYNIPADVRSLPADVHGIGTVGNNSINGRLGYAPPHSKGPGDKTYVLTLYALSAPLNLSVAHGEVTRDVLLSAMEGKVLASSKLQVIYARARTNGPRSSPTLLRPSSPTRSFTPALASPETSSTESTLTANL
jgi:Raf kinase inhibitor-like YbhB/YbcL family protein